MFYKAFVMLNEKKPVSPETSSKSKTETIRELAHRHLLDEHHTTSDEELRNATVEITDSNEGHDDSLFEIDNTPVIASDYSRDNSAKEKEKAEDEHTRQNIPNPYDVIK
jgi:hypothetical protein